MSKWVQHKSGQGERWEVANEWHEIWDCTPLLACRYAIYLPKSEYVEVSPPKVWEDVTEMITVQVKADSCSIGYRDGHPMLWCSQGYRIMKVKGYDVKPTGWAFVMEAAKQNKGGGG